MSAKKLTTRPADRGWARGRRIVAEKYLEVADLIAEEDGAAVNVCVGLCILAGIAASDAICAVAVGERYTGQDHAAAAALLGRVDSAAGKRLRDLIALKPPAHYGDKLLKAADRAHALNAAAALVEAARARTGATR